MKRTSFNSNYSSSNIKRRKIDSIDDVGLYDFYKILESIKDTNSTVHTMDTVDTDTADKGDTDTADKVDTDTTDMADISMYSKPYICYVHDHDQTICSIYDCSGVRANSCKYNYSNYIFAGNRVRSMASADISYIN
jgi:hypothetical protein